MGNSDPEMSGCVLGAKKDLGLNSDPAFVILSVSPWAELSCPWSLSFFFCKMRIVCQSKVDVETHGDMLTRKINEIPENFLGWSLSPVQTKLIRSWLISGSSDWVSQLCSCQAPREVPVFLSPTLTHMSFPRSVLSQKPLLTASIVCFTHSLLIPSLPPPIHLFPPHPPSSSNCYPGCSQSSLQIHLL